VRKIAEEVSRELGRFGPAAGISRVLEAWTGAVGPTIARNAWPARIARDGTLHVAASSSSWAFELGLLEGDILRGLRSALGKDTPPAVRFAVGKLPERGLDDEAEGRPRERPEPRAEDVEKGAEIAAQIEHDELRKLVAKAAAQSLSQAGSDRSF
jgi:predicted nucleic acid-binding Zn ribbon protein